MSKFYEEWNVLSAKIQSQFEAGDFMVKCLGIQVSTSTTFAYSTILRIVNPLYEDICREKWVKSRFRVLQLKIIQNLDLTLFPYKHRLRKILKK